LIVDRDKDACSVLQQILRSENYDVTSVHCAKDAISLSQVIDVDLFILDDNLPDMRGIILQEKIKELYPDAIFILFTNLSTVGHIDTELENPSSVFIEKPMDFRKIISSVESIIGIHRIVQKQKQSEIGIREERDKAQLYLDLAGVMFVALNSDGKITTLNRMACEILGCEAVDHIDTDWFENFIPEESREDVRNGFDLLMQDEIKPMRNYQNQVQTVTGEIRLIDWHIEILYNRDGEIIGTLSSGMDITKRARNEMELQQASRAYRAISEINKAILNSEDESQLALKACQIIVDIAGYHNAWIGYIVHDKEKTVRPVASWGTEEGYLNRLSISWAENAARYCPVEIAILQGEYAVTRNILGQGCRNCQKTRLEQEAASTIALPLIDNGKTFGSLNIFSSDLEAFHEEEVELLIELANSLTTGIKALRAANEREQVSELAKLYLDIMGHDLRNYLQGIVMATSILEVYDTNPEFESILALINKSVEKSVNLIEKAHDTHELSSTNPTTISLESTLRIAANKILGIHKLVILDTKSDLDNPRIIADNYIIRLFINILENAIQFNPHRQKRIWIVISELGEGYEVSIADNGPGINDERKKEIFDKQRRFGGIGIHQSKFLVEKYNGTITIHDRVEGDPSQGADFRIWFPKAQQ